MEIVPVSDNVLRLDLWNYRRNKIYSWNYRSLWPEVIRSHWKPCTSVPSSLNNVDRLKYVNTLSDPFTSATPFQPSTPFSGRSVRLFGSHGSVRSLRTSLPSISPFTGLRQRRHPDVSSDTTTQNPARTICPFRPSFFSFCVPPPLILVRSWTVVETLTVV